MIQRSVITIAAAAVALGTGACGLDPAEDRTADIKAAEQGDDEEEQGDAGGGNEAEVDLGGVYEFDDGLTIELSGIERGVSSEWAEPENEPYVKFTLQAQNGSDQAIDLSLLMIDCQVGDEGRRGEEIFDFEEGLGDGFTSAVMEGRDATADFACAMGEEDSYLQVEVDVFDDLMERPRIYFVGEVD